MSSGDSTNLSEKALQNKKAKSNGEGGAEKGACSNAATSRGAALPSAGGGGVVVLQTRRLLALAKQLPSGETTCQKTEKSRLTAPRQRLRPSSEVS